MFKNLGRRMLALMLVALLIVPLVGIQVFATTVTVLDGAVSVTDSANTATVSNGVVTVTAKGGLLSQTTNTITIYNDSDVTATLSFEYAASNYSSFSQSAASGTVSVLLNAGESTTMSIKGKRALSSNTATLTLSNFSLVEASASSDVTVEFDSALGSVTVDGTAVSSGYIAEGITMDAGVALAATAGSGVTFYGWIDASTGAVLSTAASFTLKPTSDVAVKPVFVSATTTTPWFKVGGAETKEQSYGFLGWSKSNYYVVSGTGYLFDDLNKAAAAAAAIKAKTAAASAAAAKVAADTAKQAADDAAIKAKTTAQSALVAKQNADAAALAAAEAARKARAAVGAENKALTQEIAKEVAKSYKEIYAGANKPQAK